MTTPFRAAAAVLSILLLAAGRAHAQGEDALVLPRGAIEGSVGGTFTHFNDVFADGRTPLGSFFATPLGAGDLLATRTTRDSLQRFFDATQARTGSGAFAVSDNDVRLGTFTPNLSAEQRRAPISVRAGVTSWLTLGVSIPIEWRRSEVDASHFVDPGIGPNPDATRNRALLEAVDPTLGGIGGSAYLPVRGTPAAQEMERRYEAMRKEGDTTTLNLPSRGINQDELQQLLPVAAVYPFFSEQRLYRPGDIEVSARLQLLNTTGARYRPGVDSSAGIRVAVEGAFRLPTGKGADLDSLLEVPTESGHGGASGAVFADVFRGRLWLSAAGRFTHPMGRDVVRRTYPAGDPFSALSDTVIVRRAPGTRLEIGITPRYRLTSEISLAARYSMAHQGATTLDPLPDAGLAYAGVESTEAQTVHLVGGGMSYSTLTAYSRGRAQVPYEFSLLLEQAVSGNGGAPATSMVTVTGRVFVQAWGGKRRPRPDTAAHDSASTRQPPAGPPADARPRQPVARPDSVSRPPAAPAQQPGTPPAATQPRVNAPATGTVVPRQPAPATTGTTPPPSASTRPTSGTGTGTTTSTTQPTGTTSPPPPPGA